MDNKQETPDLSAGSVTGADRPQHDPRKAGHGTTQQFPQMHIPNNGENTWGTRRGFWFERIKRARDSKVKREPSSPRHGAQAPACRGEASGNEGRRGLIPWHTPCAKRRSLSVSCPPDWSSRPYDRLSDAAKRVAPHRKARGTGFVLLIEASNGRADTRSG